MNGGTSVGRDGVPLGCEGVLTGLTLLKAVMGGFVATGESSGSLSSIGRDHGSICPDKERESILLRGSAVEEDEVMCG